MKKINFLGKKIAILGYGIENRSLFDWLIRHGANNITICDKNSNIKILNPKQIPNYKSQTGKDYLKNLEKFDIIFRTPGIPYLTPEIINAEKSGVEISSQIKLFFDLCPAKIIGVTGTKGKGTTTTLISEILKCNFQNKSKIINLKSKIYLGGNIGNAPMEFLDKITADDLVVLELSSFQLQDMTKSPNIAVVLDITSEHLDHHKTQKEYIEAKTNIVRWQDKNDYSVINLDYLTSFEFAVMTPAKNIWYFSRRKSVDLGAFVLENQIILRTENNQYEICQTSQVTLRGEHNLENICAAITASYLAGSSIKSIKKIVPILKGLEHRLEFVDKIDGVKYYNDSFSSMPDSTIAAIKSFTEPIILIVGGSEKGAGYSNLGREINKSTVKTVIAIGVTGQKIVKHINTGTFKHLNNNTRKPIKIITDCKNMTEIIKMAKKEAKFGDVVLLSPASASFDMFKNYKDRGEQFKLAVANLKIDNWKLNL